jgi:N-acetylmuramoyl-L-alanine amidase
MGQSRKSGPRPARGTRHSRSGGARLLVLLLAGVTAIGWQVAEGASAGGRPIDARAFAPGACVAFEPSAGDRNETVFLDAGHGSIDPGAIGSTEAGHRIEEADETLPWSSTRRRCFGPAGSA